MSIKGSSVLSLLRTLHALYGALFVGGIAIVLANGFLLTPFTVDGHSMEPTLHDRQPMAIGLAAFWLSPPSLGDVVVVRYAGTDSVRFVKRIVALPGTTVRFNGLPLTLGPDQYFVEGDNRDHSTDSRAYGPIRRDQILGKVLYPAVSAANGPFSRPED